ncbi:hypothetical protein AMTR_s00030p00121840 [Amborella trichopoda]|uniref:Uncharacterized protein n=1 Tax=Amborella trichopoda TaxID=13333 RepID=U5CS68_AMBTC|nr:hypothetical protein AMTR_s00030p00121840 [Amborella trichopoda]
MLEVLGAAFQSPTPELIVALDTVINAARDLNKMTSAVRQEVEADLANIPVTSSFAILVLTLSTADSLACPRRSLSPPSQRSHSWDRLVARGSTPREGSAIRINSGFASKPSSISSDSSSTT